MAEKKKENDFQIGNSKKQFSLANRSFIHKKVSDEGEGKSNGFFQFSREEIEIFYGFFENHAGGHEQPTFSSIATSIFVSLIHAILGNNCDIEEAKNPNKKRDSCVVFIIPATTVL